MENKVIAILENRTSEQLANLIRKNGGIPFLAPAISEVPDININELINLITKWDIMPPDIFIFQTGVGVKFLFEAVKNIGLNDKFFYHLNRAKIIVRSNKPAAALRTYNVHPTGYAKEPFTTSEVIIELMKYDLKNKNIVIQNYGEKNELLRKTIVEKGGNVTEITSYKWDLPSNVQPLIGLMDALENNRIDVVAFTSASQVSNLFRLANRLNRIKRLIENLNRVFIISIGPVCSSALRNFGVNVTKESNPPKLIYLINAINEVIQKK
ncbi:MAG: uroporphyrinogen-III synthase [Melioribacter sp.]|uniref:uroporphyrinogen-III synthase n=1 Tax=Rosettibacter primus TaxID=3111523 RepID=UPI00247D41E1|nr:uroporphyrinogen-III synthase [Melioribacter sp.]